MDKPAGKTSFDMVAAIRRMLPRKTKVGHAGTLDPFATGVLLICVGKATRLARFLTDTPKQYLAEVTLGATSDTDDTEGQITKTGAALPSYNKIEEVLSGFTGIISQRPPAYSAIHINGRRAYDMARKGETPEMPAREVRVDTINLQSYENGVAQLLIDCGKGTYIRSIARDIGEKLGCGGYCSALRRTAIGRFGAETAMKTEDITPENIENAIQDPLAGLDSLPKVHISQTQLIDISHGKTITPTSQIPEGLVAAVGPNGKLAAICETRSSHTELKPTIVLTNPPLPI